MQQDTVGSKELAHIDYVCPMDCEKVKFTMKWANVLSVKWIWLKEHEDHDGHDHHEGDGHDHKEGDGHGHKEGDGHEH